MSCVKNGWTNLNNLNDLYIVFFLRKELPFGSRDDCVYVKIFSSVHYFNRD